MLPVLLAFTLAGGIVFQHPAPVYAAVLAEGDLCPLFDVTDSKGDRYSLDQSLDRGYNTLLFFWALRCAPCLREMAYLDDLYRKYRYTGLVVLGIESARNSYDQIRDILSQLKNIELDPAYPIVADTDYRLNERFGVNVAPQTFLIDRSGTIIFYSEGFSSEIKKRLDAKIRQVLAIGAPGAPAGTLPGQTDAVSGSPTGEMPVFNHIERTAEQAELEDEFEKNRYFADFYYHRQEFDRAIPCYEKCIEIHPEIIYVRLKIGELFARKKDFVKAREMWEEILKIDPQNEEADANIRKLIRGDF